MSLAESLLEYEKSLQFLKMENENLKNRITFLEKLVPAVLKKEKSNELELLTVSEVAERLRTNKNTVYNLINKGYLVGLKLGSTKVSIEELEDFIKRSKGKSIEI